MSLFFDPIFRSTTWSLLFLSMTAASIGVLVLLRKRTLIGESLSHAAYPGLILALIISSIWNSSHWLVAACGALIASMLAITLIHWLERRWLIAADSALCFTLTLFFGLGILLASLIQKSHPVIYRHALGYLYGQATSLTDAHAITYGIIFSTITLCILFFYKEIQTLTFDTNFAKTLGLSCALFDGALLISMAVIITLGIRAVGVILMSALLILPAVAARQFVKKLSSFFILATLFGAGSAILGISLSIKGAQWIDNLSLPTGPLIVLVASFFCYASFLLAPEKGLVSRLYRITVFRYRRLCENILKAIWRMGKTTSFKELAAKQDVSPFFLRLVLSRLVRSGWIRRQEKGNYALTSDGKTRGAHLVRLHRLWEVYLATYLGAEKHRVHFSAEEIEHVLTPEIEAELVRLLHNPKRDPHQQPIPR